jgi:hypothetical protein
VTVPAEVEQDNTGLALRLGIECLIDRHLDGV